MVIQTTTYIDSQFTQLQDYQTRLTTLPNTTLDNFSDPTPTPNLVSADSDATMLFRPQEIPLPRYLLDTEEGDGPQVSVKGSFTDLETIRKLNGAETLVLVAPRLHTLTLQIPEQLECQLLFKYTITLSRKTYVDFDDESSEFDSSEVQEEIPVRVCRVKNTKTCILRLPRVPINVCQTFASQLLGGLDPKTALVVLAPSSSLSVHAIEAIYTAAWTKPYFEVPLASPPKNVLGLCAAVLSCAQRLNFAAAALLAESEGSIDYEAIQQSQLESLAKILFGFLGVERQPVSTLELSGLYV